MSPTTDAPTAATAGETLVWLLDGSDTPAVDGWVCSVTLTSPTGSTAVVTATPEPGGTDYRVTVAAAQTTSLGAGSAGWVALATLAGEVVFLGRGRIALAAASGLTLDETRLAAIDAALATLAAGGVESYQVAGRTFTHRDLRELRVERNAVAARVRRQRTGAFGTAHLVRFV